MTNTQTFTLGSGEEQITYDVHGELSTKTPLFMFGSPMDAVGFGSLLARLRPTCRHLRPTWHRP